MQFGIRAGLIGMVGMMTALMAIPLLGQQTSAIQFYDTTNGLPTAQFGWVGTSAAGNFFIGMPNDKKVTVAGATGDMAVPGQVTAAKFNGDGSGLTNLTIPAPAVSSVTGLKDTLGKKADTATVMPLIRAASGGGVTALALSDSIKRKADTTWVKSQIPSRDINATTGTLDSTRLPANVRDLAADGKIPPSAIQGTLDTAQVKNGQYMINGTGSSGQVWTSKGAGAGGWQNIPSQSSLWYNHGSGVTAYPIVETMPSYKSLRSVTFTPPSTGVVFVTANGEIGYYEATSLPVVWYGYCSIVSEPFSAHDPASQVGFSGVLNDIHLSVQTSRCINVIGGQPYTVHFIFSRIDPSNKIFTVTNPKLTVMFFKS